MDRTLLNFLKEWLISKQRKPMVIRGARQVGKTWIVRKLAKECHKDLIEINFEKNPEYVSLFSTNDPKQILLNLSAALNKQIDSQVCLLFLDEIQAAPELLAKLRWFLEDLPELAVITAGSLLEFTLGEQQFSMPVGRIQYAYLEPMSFEEFLQASQPYLLEFIKSYKITKNRETFPEALHQQLHNLFREYVIVGGLPGVVSLWINERNLIQVNQLQHDLLSTYRDDFAKYSGRLEVQTLEKVMMAIPRMLGCKFIYSHVNPGLNINTIKNALNLLNKAKICHRIYASSANGIPLGSEVREKHFKQIFLDVGLVSAMLGLNLNKIKTFDNIDLINQGAIAEQVTGQLLRTIFPPYMEPHEYYWTREEKGSDAEVDYVIEYNNQIVPVEVKAGSTGSLKSLHMLMDLKKFSLALRINADLPSIVNVEVKDFSSTEITYKLLSIPFYLIGEIPRLIDEIQD